MRIEDEPRRAGEEVRRIVHYRLMGYSPKRIAELFGWAEKYVRDVLKLRALS